MYEWHPRNLVRIFSFNGHAGVVKTTVNRTSPTPNSTSLIIPKVTKSFFKVRFLDGT
jgi:hypothetical protein